MDRRVSMGGVADGASRNDSHNDRKQDLGFPRFLAWCHALKPDLLLRGQVIVIRKPEANFFVG